MKQGAKQKQRTNALLLDYYLYLSMGKTNVLGPYMRISSSLLFRTRRRRRKAVRQKAQAPVRNAGAAVGAQMLGKCVVAADLPTSRDYIEHGKTGLLYVPSNPDSLREQLRFALRNEELVRTIGENGRRREAEISLSERDSFLSLVRKAASAKT